MKKQEVRARIEDVGIIPSVRLLSAEDALFAAEAVTHGGIPILEITLTVPNATDVIAQLRKKHPSVIVGAGGVPDTNTALLCLDSGAQFLTSDGLHVDVIEIAVKAGVVIFPGALTPTEVITASRTGCDYVKVVPCVQIGGETYIRSLNRMFPQILLIAAGGVNQQNASHFIDAGAIALGIGEELIPKDAIRLRQPDRIAELARRFTGFVKDARAQKAAREAV